MKLRICISALAVLLLAWPSAAQQDIDRGDMEWMDITTLNAVVSGQEGSGHLLKQFLLFYKPAVENEEVFTRLATFNDENGRMGINKAAPETMKDADESIAKLREMMKEFPSMASELQQAIKEVEAAMGELSGMTDESLTSYSVDPEALLRDLKKIAVNKKAYTAYMDIGNGLFAVTESPRYDIAPDDDFERVEVPEDSQYAWGAIDYSGHSVIEEKYGYFNAHVENDIIFVDIKMEDGSVHSGALGYDGRVRIPFLYDELYGVAHTQHKMACYRKGGKLGFVDFDGNVRLDFEYVDAMTFMKGMLGWLVSKDGENYGIVSVEGQLAVPVKYKSYWDIDDDDNLMIERPDGKLDILDSNTFKVLRVVDKPGY